MLIVAGVTAGVLVPAGLQRDFANFYDAGLKALAGQITDLYDSHSLIEGREPLGHMTFYSPPCPAFYTRRWRGFLPEPRSSSASPDEERGQGGSR